MGAIAFTKQSGVVNTPTGYSPTPVMNQHRVVKGSVLFSNSYATGGDTLDLATIGLKHVQGMLIEAHALNSSGLSLALGGTTAAPKILAYDANGTEVTSTTNLSGRAATLVWLLGT